MFSLRPVAWLALLLGLLLGTAQAAVIRAVDGQVEIVRGEHRIQARLGSRLREGDLLVSQSGAEALIRFDDGGRLALRPGSQIRIQQLRLMGPPDKRQKSVRVLQGGLRYVTGKTSSRRGTRFDTSKVTIGIRGTDFELMVSDAPLASSPAGTYVRVHEGALNVQALDGTQVDVHAGQAAFSGEPALAPRGVNLPRAASTRVLDAVPSGVFRDGAVDRLLK